MNYRLSVGVDRPISKSCFVIEAQGEEISSKVMKMKSENIKKEILNTIALGLRSCKSVVKHEDSLIIDVQNRHLYQWLTEGIDYKGYEKELDDVYLTLDTVDCKYRFVFNENPYAKLYLKKHKVDQLEGSSIKDMFE